MRTDTQPSMLEVLSQELESIDEAYHTFLLIYKEHSQCVYGFVEGKDDPAFYKYLIKSQLPDDWEIKLITSGNKQKVIRSFTSFNWTDYSRKRICFFIDRDLQDFLEVPQKLDDNLYITDGYSIENSILQDDLIFEVLSDIYQITQLREQEEDIIKQVIRKNEELFFESIMPLMGQILLWTRSGCKPNLNNLELDKIFSFSQANLVSSNCNKILEVAAKQLGCNLCDDTDISAAENEIRSHINAQNLVRGKYAFWLFVRQCEAIWKAIPVLLKRFPNRTSKRIEYGLPNAMIILGPRVRIPKSLRNFIQNNYLSFIREISDS